MQKYLDDINKGEILKVYHKGRQGIYFFGIILEIGQDCIKILSLRDNKKYHFGKNVVNYWISINEAEILK